MNNPLKYTDPTGAAIPLLIITIIGIAAAGTGVTATVSPEVASVADPVILGAGFVPVVGDLVSDPNYFARSTSRCGLQEEWSIR